MTTEKAAASYLAQHNHALEGRGYAVYNPNNKPVDELPIIYGFNNGGSPGMLSAILLAEDGTHLGSHCCSDEGYMRNDLGILEGTRSDRHETFQKHYPDGYRMDFVTAEENRADHSGLVSTLAKNQEMFAQAAAKAKKESSSPDQAQGLRNMTGGT